MKFVCDRCSTRYSISDEKVRGKVLKIRCKTCSNIIVVREQAADAQASQGAAAAAGGQNAVLRGPAPRTAVDIPKFDAPVAASNANTEWWVAIKGAQHGPMKKAELERFYEEGRITARSYCWNESLSSWTRLAELPDFQELVKRPQGEKKPAPPPPPSDDAGAEVVDLQKARAEREAERHTPTSSRDQAANDPFAAAAAASGPVAESGRPGESTRVFIMQAGLANRQAKHRTYAIAALVASLVLIVGIWGDWTGRWEIPGLHGALSIAAEKTGVEVPQQRLLASWDDVQPDLEEKCQLNPGDPACVQYFAEKAAYLRKARGKGGKKAGSDELNLDGAFQQGGGGSGGIQRAGSNGSLATVDPFGSNTGQAGAIADVFAGDKKRAAAPVGKMPTAPVVSGGSGPDPEAIGQVVKDNAGAVKSCIEQGMKTGSTVEGKHYLVLTVEPRGVVSNARFKNGVVNASPVGECIRKRARKWKFPAFVGEATDIEVPYILSAGF